MPAGEFPIVCPGCGRNYRAATANIGQWTSCAGCGARFPIEQPVEAVAVLDEGAAGDGAPKPAQRFRAPSPPAPGRRSAPPSVRQGSARQRNRRDRAGGAVDALSQTSPWVAIVGFTMLVVWMIYVLISLVGAFGAMGHRRGGPMLLVSFLTIAVVTVQLGIPAFLLLRYRSAINRFTRTREQRDLAGALDAQRVFWKFTAIVLLTVLALGVVLFMAGLAAMPG